MGEDILAPPLSPLGRQAASQHPPSSWFPPEVSSLSSLQARPWRHWHHHEGGNTCVERSLGGRAALARQEKMQGVGSGRGGAACCSSLLILPEAP